MIKRINQNIGLIENFNSVNTIINTFNPQINIVNDFYKSRMHEIVDHSASLLSAINASNYKDISFNNSINLLNNFNHINDLINKFNTLNSNIPKNLEIISNAIENNFINLNISRNINVSYMIDDIDSAYYCIEEFILAQDLDSSSVDTEAQQIIEFDKNKIISNLKNNKELIEVVCCLIATLLQILSFLSAISDKNKAPDTQIYIDNVINITNCLYNHAETIINDCEE